MWNRQQNRNWARKVHLRLLAALVQELPNQRQLVFLDSADHKLPGYESRALFSSHKCQPQKNSGNTVESSYRHTDEHEGDDSNQGRYLAEPAPVENGATNEHPENTNHGYKSQKTGFYDYVEVQRMEKKVPVRVDIIDVLR